MVPASVWKESKPAFSTPPPLDPDLLDGLQGQLLDMEPVYDPCGPREAYLHDLAHALRQVHGHLRNPLPAVLSNVLDGLDDGLRFRPPDYENLAETGELLRLLHRYSATVRNRPFATFKNRLYLYINIKFSFWFGATKFSTVAL